MRKLSHFIAVSILLCFSQLVWAAATPVGYWKTIDDVTGQPKSILHIWQASNKAIYGRIMKIYPSPGKDQNELCTECPDGLKNKPIVGLTILQGLRQSQSNPMEWSGGSILDPKNGKTYNCYVTVIDGGARLTVRGYIGLPAFGRNQTWIRVSSPKG